MVSLWFYVKVSKVFGSIVDTFFMMFFFGARSTLFGMKEQVLFPNFDLFVSQDIADFF